MSEEKGVNNVKEALQGAMDIIAEMISDEAEYRAYIRQATFEEGKIVSTARMQRHRASTRCIMSLRRL